MIFSELLIDYCEKVGCSNVELSKASGVDASLISRLKNGSRTIAAESETLMKLSKGLLFLAREKSIANFPKDIYEKFNYVLLENSKKELEQITIFSQNLNYIIEQLNISNAHLAKFLSVDPSLISRIRSGKRKPADMDSFITDFSDYLKKYFFTDNHFDFYLNEFGLGCDELSCTNFKDRLSDWLVKRTLKNENSITHFLEKLNDFNLEEYIAAIRFNDIHIPKVPFALPVKKHYCGFGEMRTGTVDFLKMVATSKKVGAINIFSDFTIEKLSEDVSFSKKWMFGLAMIIKRGNHINQIHYLDRPFKEIMLGLEAWIPLYMTGQISPYYMKCKTNQVFCHLLFCAPGIATLSGEAIAAHEDEGRYFLSNKQEDMNYFEKRSQRILEAASPLMNIYKKENEKQFYETQKENSDKSGTRKHILSSPALYTIPNALLKSMIGKSSLSSTQKDIIKQQADELKQRMERMLKFSHVTDILPILSEEEFYKEPLKLQLTDIFEHAEITYSYAEYLLHIEGMEHYKSNHDNYNYMISSERGYKNIQIFIHEGHSVTVQKSDSPNIVFVIKHKQLCEAFQNMEIPVRD